jgi:hypothetical protein
MRDPYAMIDNNCGAVERAVKDGDWSWVAGWVAGRFGKAVTTEWCENCCRELTQGRMNGARWSDGSWALYWKTQLINDGYFSSPTVGVETFRLEVPLHVFFLSLEESDEMLQRLKRKEPEDDGNKRRKVATPGIERVTTSPEPIDRVAARVVR